MDHSQKLSQKNSFVLKSQNQEWWPKFTKSMQENKFGMHLFKQRRGSEDSTGSGSGGGSCDSMHFANSTMRRIFGAKCDVRSPLAYLDPSTDPAAVQQVRIVETLKSLLELSTLP